MTTPKFSDSLGGLGVLCTLIVTYYGERIHGEISKGRRGRDKVQ
jgi:hypothetical protein